MTCQELADFILDFVEGRLPEDQAKIFEEHLAVCPSCIAYIDSYRSTCRMIDDACCSEEPPKKVPEKLVQAILRARRAGGDQE